MSETHNPGGDYQIQREQIHPHCFACAPEHPFGLQLQFTVDESGALSATFACAEKYEGYPKYLHGGITSTLLDAVMTNCLIAAGTPGLTGKLEIRFLNPVLIGQDATIRGWQVKSRGPLHVMASELAQNGEILATASAVFMEF